MLSQIGSTTGAKGGELGRLLYEGGGSVALPRSPGPADPDRDSGHAGSFGRRFDMQRLAPAPSSRAAATGGWRVFDDIIGILRLLPPIAAQQLPASAVPSPCAR